MKIHLIIDKTDKTKHVWSFNQILFLQKCIIQRTYKPYKYYPFGILRRFLSSWDIQQCYGGEIFSTMLFGFYIRIFFRKNTKMCFFQHITNPSIFCGALYLHITSHLAFATPVKQVKGFQVLGPWWIGGTPRICHVRGSAWNGLENDKGTTAPRTERGRAFGAVWPCQGEAWWILVEDHFLLVSKWLGSPQVYL